MTTFDRPKGPTGYSDDDGNWITRIEYIARFCIPQLKPAQRQVFSLMRQGYIFVDGEDRKFSLRKDEEIIPVRAWLPAELLEDHGESKRKGPPDRLGKRKTYITRSYRLNQHAIMAANALEAN